MWNCITFADFMHRFCPYNRWRHYVCMFVIFIRCDKRTSNIKHKKQSQNDVQYKAAKPKTIKTISLLCCRVVRPSVCVCVCACVPASSQILFSTHFYVAIVLICVSSHFILFSNLIHFRAGFLRFCGFPYFLALACDACIFTCMRQLQGTLKSQDWILTKGKNGSVSEGLNLYWTSIVIHFILSPKNVNDRLKLLITNCC